MPDQLPAELEAILPAWRTIEPLTKEAALTFLKRTFAAGYTDYDNDLEVRFGIEDVEWTETTRAASIEDFEGQLNAAQLTVLRKKWTCTAISWHAAVSLCGELRRTCLRLEHGRESLVLSPEESLDKYTDRTFGPMWEGW